MNREEFVYFLIGIVLIIFTAKWFFGSSNVRATDGHPIVPEPWQIHYENFAKMEDE